MGIYIIKIINRIKSLFIISLYKILYTKRLKTHRKLIMYPGTHIVIEKSGKLVIGENCFFNKNCSINCMNSINIGSDCLFGENVLIYDHNHEYKESKIIIKKQGYKVKTVNIENNCWICTNVVILPGVTIGENSIIGAGCVINKDIPKNSIVHQKNDNYVIKERT